MMGIKACISLALQGSEGENIQDALRVLDIILRQKAANMYFKIPLSFVFLNFYNYLPRVLSFLLNGIMAVECRG